MRAIPVLLILASALLGCGRQEEPPKAQPARPTPAAESKSAILGSYPGKDTPWKMLLVLDPPQPQFGAKTRTRVKITDAAGAPVTGAEVRASLVMPLHDMGKNEYQLAPAGEGVYEGTANFSMAGEWEIILTAKAGGKTGKHTFNVQVEE